MKTASAVALHGRLGRPDDLPASRLGGGDGAPELEQGDEFRDIGLGVGVRAGVRG